MQHPLYCPDCDTTGLHTIEGSEATCQACGSVREVEPDALAGVVAVERCAYCRMTHPVDSECCTDTTPCLRKTGLWPCGTCEACIAAQRADLVKHGSPEDLHIP
ncbi:hypothetical protein ABT294_00830 [Nonomuraea sp. NPDC000554]|uniref:hypothetical protein n=1 Tax=Nonomuraea sp. NPDC000554 TaxID=3154259 RepID=UPI00331705D9